MASNYLSRWIDVLLDALEGSRDTTAEHLKGENLNCHVVTRDIKFFSPAEPLIGDVNVFTDINYDRGFFSDVSPQDISDGYWDTRIINMPKDEDIEHVRFNLIRCRRVPLLELRGIPIRSSWVAALTVGFLYHDGSFYSNELLFNWIGKEWVHLIAPQWRQRGATFDGRQALPAGFQPQFFRKDEQSDFQIRLALGLAFTRDYEWTVEIGRPNGLSLLFVTDPVGARAAFRLRDAPELQSRRAALRNWICEHWRQSRRDDRPEVKVREHLRGRTAFTWQGLNCTIMPSAYDLRRNEQLAIERQQERERLKAWAISRFGQKAQSWPSTSRLDEYLKPTPEGSDG